MCATFVGGLRTPSVQANPKRVAVWFQRDSETVRTSKKNFLQKQKKRIEGVVRLFRPCYSPVSLFLSLGEIASGHNDCFS